MASNSLRLLTNNFRSVFYGCNIRLKHSKRQVKNKLQGPAKERREARLGIFPKEPKPLPPRQFPAIFKAKFLPNGWSAPPSDKIEIPKYPFSITRTRHKPGNAVGFLPVYSKFRKDGARETTLIKRLSGDQNAFLSELRAVLEMPEPHNPKQDTIRIRTGGAIEVKGNRTREVKSWLAGLGF
mmetsp:Transcript_32847/g.49557  ORF Transcript_32847/g.49557 Transcript_32847/m.49557 type:complete len:182 (-) Transcript_32847:3261-3806(-)